MLTEEAQLSEPVPLGVDTMPLGFVISDDGRMLLAVTGRTVCTANACLLLPKHLPENCQNHWTGLHSGNGDGVIELMTTPVAFFQQSDTVVRPATKINNATPRLSLIRLENFTTASIQQTTLLPSESNKTVSIIVRENVNTHIKGASSQLDNGSSGACEKGESFATSSIESVNKIPVKRNPGRPRKDVTSLTSNMANKIRCEIYNQEFTRQLLYRKYMEHHAEEKPHRCSKCSASFNLPTNFTLHMATHNTGEPKCPECGRRFARMASLKSHMLLHEKEESLFCTCDDGRSSTESAPSPISSDERASCASTKTPAPQSSPQPRIGSISSSSAASSSSARASPASQLLEHGLPESGTGPSSKSLNKFLRGSDLLTSLTSTFDRKRKSLVNPSNLLMTSAECERTSMSDNDRGEEKFRSVVDRDEPQRPVKVYRDPSLHKSPAADNSRLIPPTNGTPENRTNCSVVMSTERRKVESITPDNDRHAGKITSEAVTDSYGEGSRILDATEKDESPKGDGNVRAPCVTKSKHYEIINTLQEDAGSEVAISRETDNQEESHENAGNACDPSYTNKLEKFDSLSQANVESRSRLKRAESLSKRSGIASTKLKRSESLNKHPDRLASPSNGKLKRSESLNKYSDRSESPNTKLKRSESLTKTEKTECNISKRRQSVRKESAMKLKRKN